MSNKKDHVVLDAEVVSSIARIGTVNTALSRASSTLTATRCWSTTPVQPRDSPVNRPRDEALRRRRRRHAAACGGGGDGDGGGGYASRPIVRDRPEGENLSLPLKGMVATSKNISSCACTQAARPPLVTGYGGLRGYPPGDAAACVERRQSAAPPRQPPRHASSSLLRGGLAAAG